MGLLGLTPRRSDTDGWLRQASRSIVACLQGCLWQRPLGQFSARDLLPNDMMTCLLQNVCMAFLIDAPFRWQSSAANPELPPSWAPCGSANGLPPSVEAMHRKLLCNHPAAVLVAKPVRTLTSPSSSHDQQCSPCSTQ